MKIFKLGKGCEIIKFFLFTYEIITSSKLIIQKYILFLFIYSHTQTQHNHVLCKNYKIGFFFYLFLYLSLSISKKCNTRIDEYHLFSLF